MRVAAFVILICVAVLVYLKSADPQHRDAVIENMADWEVVAQEEWPRTQADTVANLLTPMVGGFPSRLEGRPSITMTARRLEDDPVMVAHVRASGFLDDSVNGVEFTALIESKYQGWVLVALWRRHQCARGFLHAFWTTRPCS